LGLFELGVGGGGGGGTLPAGVVKKGSVSVMVEDSALDRADTWAHNLQRYGQSISIDSQRESEQPWETTVTREESCCIKGVIQERQSSLEYERDILYWFDRVF
jgi:hypothetical protein